MSRLVFFVTPAQLPEAPGERVLLLRSHEEPQDPDPNWQPPDWPQTREEPLERRRNTPVHLCRQRYFGREARWECTFSTYSDDRYVLSVHRTGEFLGTPG